MHIIEGLRQLHSFYGADLLRVRLNASAGHQETEKLFGRDAEGALGRIQFDSESSQVGKCFSKIIEQGLALFRLDDDIINIDLHILADLIM